MVISIMGIYFAGVASKRETQFGTFFVTATPFFAGGATLGYLILPVAIKVLFGFTPHALSNLVKFDDYLDFVMRVVLLFGLAFELPIFLVGLNLVGFLSGKSILRSWRI
jgi:sec-independent protein translocase protein TatC